MADGISYTEAKNTLLGKFLGAALLADRANMSQYNLSDLHPKVLLGENEIDLEKLFTQLEKTLAKEGVVAVYTEGVAPPAPEVPPAPEPVPEPEPAPPAAASPEFLRSVIQALDRADTAERVRFADAVDAAAYVAGERVGETVRAEASEAAFRHVPAQGTINTPVRELLVAELTRAESAAG